MWQVGYGAIDFSAVVGSVYREEQARIAEALRGTCSPRIVRAADYRSPIGAALWAAPARKSSIGQVRRILGFHTA